MVVDHNIAAFARIVTAKYERGATSNYEEFGQSFPGVDVTLEDMQRSGEEFTAERAQTRCSFQWAAA